MFLQFQQKDSIQVLTSVGQNLSDLLSNFDQVPASINFGPELDVLHVEAKLLRENIEYLIKTQLSGIHKGKTCRWIWIRSHLRSHYEASARPSMLGQDGSK